MATPSEIKHRESLFQRFCAEILREGADIHRLTATAHRVLNDPEVSSDPELCARLRSFISAKENEIQVTNAEQSGTTDNTQVWTAFGSAAEDNLADAITSLERSRLRFEDRAAHLDERGAKQALEAVERITHRYHEMLNDATLKQVQLRMRLLTSQCEAFRTHIGDLVARAADAGQRGDRRTTQWALRRFSAVHSLRPSLIPKERGNQIFKALSEADEAARNVAAKGIRREERHAAAEIRDLATKIRHFRKHAKRMPEPADPEFEEFSDAVKQLHKHDQKWLNLLENTLARLAHDAEGANEADPAEIDWFLKNVRESLHRLEQEVASVAGPHGE